MLLILGDCSEYHQFAIHKHTFPKSGPSTIYVGTNYEPILADCTRDGWTVIQSRGQFNNSKDLFLISNSISHNETPLEMIATKNINRQITSLGDDYKVPFELHFQGFKYKEIADRLGIPIGTVKSRIFIARKKLMDLLPEYTYLAN